MAKNVEKYLLEKIESEGSIHITLIDPEKVTPPQASRIAKKAKASGTSAIMIGGSTFVSTLHLDNVVKAVKRTVKFPVILFPNNVTGISRYADAIWFMSLLNSMDPYFLIGAQILGAPLIKKYGLEPLPLGYIIIGDGGTAGIVGKAVPIPYDKPELAAAHALAGQYLGMRFIYLEAGSGAKKPVPSQMIKAVKRYIDVPLIVGGGIKTRRQALAAASAGADIIVTGNVVENSGAKRKVADIIKGIKSAGSI
ncbi:geranylgeranylglyceryl/heptaprenylglyceryl phosphate synthase [Candidatus Bathyarchaeota archaeon]|nr:MAG: geranylgeranylglyceryl/heptaprenylglyceryl phosphate synthase [Candidatus Bathyarchaeota archaeon]RLI15447.1 MAG: geranylgeranylglyceryl/heptaprenylglyceryl phosphate synthase [Candidatus Bathyarchaeota archaeon]RLI20890.1 MAG: geranylgeranylglyceryl/heptaprenylglyceryl phosphate synthase [Candidatus Bathyarchaeota archaeon]